MSRVSPVIFSFIFFFFFCAVQLVVLVRFCSVLGEIFRLSSLLDTGSLTRFRQRVSESLSSFLCGYGGKLRHQSPPLVAS